MILKFILTATNFAGLAKFIASDDNKLGLLQERHPGCHPTFVDGSSYQCFASILKSTPHKGTGFKNEEELDVTVLAAEHYKTDHAAPERRLPQQYINRLFRSTALYPFERTFVRTRVFNSGAQPLVYKTNADFTVFEHISMGEVVLEKRVDGKLYVNDIEVIRRLVPKELGEGDSKRASFVPGEDKSKLLNACFYDAILADPLLIPEDWKGYTFFRGTIFQAYSSKWVKSISRYSDEKLYVGQAGVGHYNLTRDDSWEAVLAA